MASTERSRVLWQYKHWRCEYEPISEERGIFRLFDADVRVIEAECSPDTATHDFAETCRGLVEIAECRRDQRWRGMFDDSEERRSRAKAALPDVTNFSSPESQS